MTLTRYVHSLWTKATHSHDATCSSGLITGAADDDPAGITIHTQAGAMYGTLFSWFSLVTFPLMAVVQEMCARIGLVTGKGLAAHIGDMYSSRMLFVLAVLLLSANTLNIAADIAAMGEAVRLLVPSIPHIPIVLAVGGITLFLIVRLPYARYARYLQYLTISLFAYVLVALLSDIDWGTVAYTTFVPQIPASKEAFFLLAALLGTTISPYLFFWQTAQEIEEVEEERKHLSEAVHTRHQASQNDVRRMQVDVWIGMFVSNLVTFFIVIAAAATLHAQGTRVETLGDAMQALQAFGSLAPILFAVGILGTGMLAIPILAASAAYAFAEALHVREGLGKTFTEAKTFYGCILVAIGGGTLASVIGFDPVTMLLYSGFANALLAPIILFFIIRIAGNARIMRGYASSRLQNIIAWITAALLAGVCAVVLLG